MKKWFLNLRIRSRLNTMTSVALLSIFLIGFASYYLLRTTSVLTLVLTEQRIHDVNYRSGVQLFYEYLYDKNENTLQRAYHHLDSAAQIAFVFSKSKEMLEQKSFDQFVDVLLENYGPTINHNRKIARLLASRIALTIRINNPQMNEALAVADEAYRNGRLVKSSIIEFLEHPDEKEVFEKLEQAKYEMSLMEIRFAKAINELNNFVIRLLLISILLISILLGVITFITSSYISSTISKPVMKVVENLKSLALGDLSTDIQPETTDEIGKLQQSFLELQSSLKQKTDVASAIAEGNFLQKATQQSEKDILAIAINQIVTNFSEVIEQANQIARGNLETSITMRSAKDELGKSLITMTSELKKSNEDKQRQLWIKNNQTDINDLLRGEQEVTDLSRKIISKICHILGAKVGAIYLKNEDGIYKLMGSYAFTHRKNIKSDYSAGEGIIGQAALEKQPIIVSQLPDDYVAISSGLGEAPPRNLIVVPCIFNEEVIAIIELGSFETFTDNQLNFLSIISETIAIGLHTSRSRTELEKLLTKTQQQAEELQVQQEELRQANEELQEQTIALKESEQQLQTQQEELRVTNEELQERTHAIEKQRDDIRKKNEILKQAQLEIEQKARDLEMASRYKSEFLANMSHELRTPLNSILVLSQVLSNNKNGNLTEKQIQSAKTIYSSGASLLSLINEILDLSKIESGKLQINIEKISITNFSNEIKEIFAPLALEKGLDFTVNIADNTPLIIHNDNQRLQQIIRNLLANAIKFTNQGSVNLNILKSNPTDKNRPKKISDNDAIVFEVADTGIGIPQAQQEVIFQAFTQADGTTSRKYGGTGLGLTISRNLAHLLGGEITLESEPDKGTIFRLWLPLTIEKTEHHTPDSMPEKTESLKTQTSINKTEDTVITKTLSTANPQYHTSPNMQNIITDGFKDDRTVINKGDKFILVIEDDHNFAKILYDLAHEKGFKCLIAPNGETGLHYADYYKPDAIILDIGLPGIDGWQVMDRLKDNPETRHIPVHFMSGKDKSIEALKMGAIGYLTKPISLEDLEEAFSKIEAYISKPFKKLLVVEDDDNMRKAIVELIDDKDISITSVPTGNQAIDQLRKNDFDCIILDLGLKDMPGDELLKIIGKKGETSYIPVIIYTGKELSREDEERLLQYSDRIIIKGVRSPERLLAETTLFLHRVESSLPEEKQKMLRMTHSKEDIMKDKKILIVDDDMRNVFALSSLLEEKGLKIEVGRNGKEGLAKLEQFPDINLVLMDIMMPEMDGYEAIRRIRKNPKTKKMPVIALTAKAMQGDRDKCIEAGANDYLTKPVDTAKLLSLLRVWLYQ
ncbi:MAG TPA: response regulator [Bacteroidales bacterium]|nr:response regulator [Bacteroidales bacterium]